MCVHLTRKHERFVRSLVRDGRHASADEVVAEALRLLEQRESGRDDHETRVEALLIAGLESGPATPMTSEDWDEVEREGDRIIAARKARRSR